jgi:hypothetical protein
LITNGVKKDEKKVEAILEEVVVPIVSRLLTKPIEVLFFVIEESIRW